MELLTTPKADRQARHPGEFWSVRVGEIPRAIDTATQHRRKNTIEKGWQALKHFLFVAAGLGEATPSGPCAALVVFLRDLHPKPLPEDILADAAEAVASLVRDINNRQVVNSANPRTRANFVANLSDGGNLYLIVSDTGSRKWVLRFTWRGAAKEMGLERAKLTSTFAAVLGSNTTLDELLGAWVNGRWLEAHPAGHSFCKCGPDKLDLAASPGHHCAGRPAPPHDRGGCAETSRFGCPSGL